MKIGVCEIACEKCPRKVQNKCPNGFQGCVLKENGFCKIATCAYHREIKLCFEYPDFPCKTTKEGPVHYEYCKFISGKNL